MQAEFRAAGFERWVERNKFLVVAIVTVLYFGRTILLARGKPFWFDEVVVLLSAHQPSLDAAVNAARDLDLAPPLTHVIGYLVNKLAGSGEVVFRLPSMIGFWVFCLCLFGFTVRRVSVLFALGAMLLPFATAGYLFSFEARCYGLLLGCCGVALLSWQTAAAGERRVLAIAGLALGIGGALLNHYYAVMIYLPLAGAEAWRSFGRRKIDWPIWMAFAAGAMPLVVSLPTVKHLMDTNQHPWARAQVQNYMSYYLTVFGYSLAFLIPALVLAAAWFVLGGSKEPGASRRTAVPDHELLAAALLLLIPVAAITVALVVPPHQFTNRYAIPAIGGFALLSAFFAAQVAGGRSGIAVAFAIAVFVPFAAQLSQVHSFRNPLEQQPVLREALERGPVVVNDNLLYLQTWYYAPDTLKPRLLYLSDEASSLKYFNMDGDMEVFRKFGVPVADYRDFAVPGKEFFLYVTPAWGWVPQKVLDDGGAIEIVKWRQGTGLLRARVK